MHEGSELKLESAHGVQLLRRDVRTRNGVIVSVNDMSCSPGRAWHDISPRQNRMAIVLEQIGGRVEARTRSEEHTSELQSRQYLVCRLLLEKKKKKKRYSNMIQRH